MLTSKPPYLTAFKNKLRSDIIIYENSLITDTKSSYTCFDMVCPEKGEKQRMTDRIHIKGYLYDDRGTWAVRARVPDPKTGKTKMRSKSTGFKSNGNKRKAEIKMREYIAIWEQEANTGYTLGYNPTFEECAIEWLDIKQTQIRPNTHSSYEILVKEINSKIGKVRIGDISRHILQAYLNQMSGTAAVSTIRKHRYIINAILENSQFNGVISSNPAYKLNIPKGKKFTGTSLDEEQLKQLFSNLDSQPEPTKAIITLAVTYGLRRSEIVGLRWCDIDFKQNIMHIRNTTTAYAGVIYEGEQTKTDSSCRDVYLVGQTVPYLKALKATHEKQGFTSGKVCCYANGKGIKPDYASRTAQKFFTACNFENVRLHDMRHTAASLYSKKLLPQQTQAFLGHTDIQTTMNIYTHSLTSEKINTSCVVGELLKNVGFCSESCSETDTSESAKQ